MVPAVNDVAEQQSKDGELAKVNYSTADDRRSDQNFNLTRNNVPLVPSAQNPEPNKCTKISVSISAISSASGSSTSSVGSSGLFTASGGFNCSTASAKASQSASDCTVDISFEALLVTINWSWLHGKLFADPELNVAADVKLSPGAAELKEAIDNKDASKLGNHANFPSYPTSFIVASNIEREFRDDSTSLEETVESLSFDTNLQVSYGLFSLGASHKQDKSSAKTCMETTATGTRISLGPPAIIGWVSMLLPWLLRLPRPKNGNNSPVQPLIEFK